MSALSMIRNNIGFVVVVIAISLLGFILTDFFSSMGNIVGGPSDAGVVAGETISAREFSERYQQSLRNSNLPENQRFFLVDQVWNQMVNEIVFENEYERVGLQITGAEVYDMFTGKEIHPVVQQYFTPPGSDYDRSQVKELLQQMLDDSAQSAQLKLFEDYLADTRAQERYLAMISSAFVGSKQLARQKYQEENKKVDLTFLGVNYTQVPDSLVSVSDAELRAYINDHEETYQQQEQLYIKYVKFDITPTAADSAKAFENILKQKPIFAEVQNDSLFVAGKSRIPFNPNAAPRPVSQLPKAIQDSVVNADEKDVLGPVLDGKYYKLYKVVAREAGDETFANVQHILITPEGNTRADTLAAQSRAASLKAQTTAANIDDMVNEHSRDFGSKIDDGVLGWYRKGTYGADFDAAVSRASIGSIIGPVKSPRGFHIIRVLDKTNSLFSVAEIESEIYPSSETEAAFYREANQFAAKAQGLGNIDSAATEMGLTATRSNALTKTSWQVLGLPPSQGSRDLVIWAAEAEEGEFSEVKKVGNLSSGESYVFATLDQQIPEGVRGLETARTEVTRIVTNQKKAAIIKEKLATASGDDLNAIKDAYGAGAFVSQASDIAFSNQTIPGIGGDPLVIGTALGLNEGERSGMIEGTNGVYILQVTAVKEAPELDESALADRQQSTAEIGANELQSKVPSALTELADVEDNRYKIGY